MSLGQDKYHCCMHIITRKRLNDFARDHPDTRSALEHWYSNMKRGLDHRVGHFRPLRIMAQVLERLVFRIVMCFRIARKQKGVADAMIEA